MVRGGLQWKVDVNDLDAGGSGTGGGGAGDRNGGELRGEFRRASSVGPSSGHTVLLLLILDLRLWTKMTMTTIMCYLDEHHM